jgi:D-psicose/D-tagatose/L-ribulose 3-epimerase
MKFAVNALIWTTEFDRRSFSLLPRLRAQGFDGFEVPVFEPAKFQAGSIRRALAENDLECTVCAILPNGMNPTSEDAEIRRQTRQHLADTIKLAADLGSNLMAAPYILRSDTCLAAAARPMNGNGRSSAFSRWEKSCSLTRLTWRWNR